MSSPLVIGGTGGSGTRVVAKIVRRGGRFMGSDLNKTDDTKLFFRFDWEWGVRYLEGGSSPAMEREFEETLAAHLADCPDGSPWGWKAPHSYLLIPFLRARFPAMRYIHVIRDGRDMALSSNRIQPLRYGHLLNRPDEPESVRLAAWWAWANIRAGQAGGALGDDYLVVRFEDLCADPRTETRRIVEFSGFGDEALASEVVPPQSLGRWRGCDASLLQKVEATCGEALQRFGYTRDSAVGTPLRP